MTAQPLVAGIACVAVLASAASARPPIIDQGWDYLITEPESYMGFPPNTTLPAGFFGTRDGVPSDPLTLPARLPLIGRPIGVIPPNAPTNFYVGPVTELDQLNAHRAIDGRLVGRNQHDTAVRRLTDAVFTAVGTTVTVPIRITDLSLQAPAPIPVTFSGTIESFFDVWVSLDPDFPSPEGSLSLTLTSEAGGTLTSTLPINFRTSFRTLDPLVTPSGNVINGQIVLSGTGIWSVPAPGAAATLALLGLLAARRRR